jgi:hypothetical protein
MTAQETKELLEKNRTRFNEMNAKYKLFSPELLAFLGDGLFTAPASTTEELHNCFPGGLLDHLIRVGTYAVRINNALPKPYPVEQVIKVSFLSEIGKVGLYEFNTVDWQIKKGQLYTFNENLTSLRVGERSAYYALTMNTPLTPEEYQALINYEKSSEDRAAKWHTSTLGVILRQAIELAIIEEKGD